jgi:dihydrofolate synthase / folylpolyglutamate synthase
MSYPDSVRFLYSLGNELKTAKFGLERISILLSALGNPQNSFASVHIAGTNGKGSVCAMIESGLRASGAQTGLYTSPHLLEPTERIRVAGVPVTESDFSSAFEEVHAVAERLLEEGRIDLHPTYFETVTAMAFRLFERRKVEMAVLEVGLGGRLDATNVVHPRLCVITPIDFDHERFLGNSIPEIAAEKAGILKQGVPAVFAEQRPEAEAVLDARAASLDVPVTKTSPASIKDLCVDRYGHKYTSHRHTPGGIEVSCPLAGEHQVENSLCALTALTQLRVERQAIEEGIRTTSWPGRLQRISDHPEIIVDGAHNPSGAKALATYLRRFYRPEEVTLVYGTMRDKAIEEVTSTLFATAGTVILTAPKQDRALRPEVIRSMSTHPDLHIADTLERAMEMIDRSRTTVISGSLFLVGEALSRFGCKPDIISRTLG